MATQDKLLKEIEAGLISRGERFTAPRRQVMAALLKAKAPQTAYEIIEKIKDIKPMSVYRALDFLSAQGLVHRIESLNAYVSCAENHCVHNDSQFMICDNCGASAEIHDHKLDKQIAENIARSGFRIGRKIMEIHGTCKRCV